MIDGIKILCNYLTVKQLTDNIVLHFPLLVSEKTGEVLPSTRISKYKGLIFRLSPSTIDKNIIHKTIQGSIHKYRNNGKHNANDFSFDDFCNTVENLKNEFRIIPEKSKLQNFEIGININLSVDTQQFINSIVSMPNKKFTSLSVENVKIGKIAKFSEYNLKIYDKQLTDSNIKQNILRLELKIKKMRFVKRYGIETLADLTNPDKFNILVFLFTKILNDLIVYDYDIDEKQLSIHQQLFLSKHINPLFWQRLDHKNRYQHKQRFTDFLNKYSNQSLKKEVFTKVYEKIKTLAPSQRKRIDVFTNFADEKKQLREFDELRKTPENSKRKKRKRIDVFTRIIKSENALFPDSKNALKVTQILPENLKENKRNLKKCEHCQKEFTSNHKNAKYCSAKCRQKHYQQQKTKRNLQARKNEVEILNKLKANLTNKRIKVKIYTATETIELTKSKVKFNYIERRAINKVEVTTNKKTYILTTLRAKQFIKALTDYNETKKRYCLHCKTNITHKHKNAKYCSIKCQKKHNKEKQAKKEVREQITQRETKKKLKKLIQKNENVNLNIKIKDSLGTRTRIIKAKELDKVKLRFNHIEYLTAYNGRVYKLNKDIAIALLVELQQQKIQSNSKKENNKYLKISKLLN